MRRSAQNRGVFYFMCKTDAQAAVRRTWRWVAIGGADSWSTPRTAVERQEIFKFISTGLGDELDLKEVRGRWWQG